jgi:thymidylate synthase
MNNLDKTYQDLLKDILENGTRKGDRTGTGTISVFGRQIRHKMSDGFPLLTTKKMYMKGIITELIWFLRGDTNIKYLLDNDCHIWDGDTYKNYEKKALDVIGENEKDKLISKEEFINKIKTDDEFAKKWGELGPVYGKQWRSWNCLDKDAFLNTDNIEDPLLGSRGLFFKEYEIDQIANLINDLKTNPDSRRLMVNAWNVGELDQMTLPPCHYSWQVYTRELSLEERVSILGDIQTNDNGYYEHSYAKLKCDEHNVPKRAISLMWNQRSVDTFLGLPFNIASYGLLLEIIAKEVNMVPDELIGNLGDVHLYSNHVEQAIEQIGRDLRVDERVCMCYENPKLDLSRLQEGMSDEEFTKVCDEFEIPTRTREPYPLPTLNIKLHFNNEPSFVPEQWLIDDFEIIGYKAHPTIKAPLSN